MYKSIDVKRIDDIVLDSENILIDIREKYEYILGNIPNSINIPLNYLKMLPEEYLSKSKRYYIYCDSGSTSRKLCIYLSELGYDVVDLFGGYKEYLEKFA